MLEPMEPSMMKITSTQKLPATPISGMQDRVKKAPAQHEKAGLIAVGHIAHNGLHYKGQKAEHPGDQPHLGQRKSQLVGQGRQQGAYERGIEISGKVNQKQSKYNFFIQRTGLGHGSPRHGAWQWAEEQRIMKGNIPKSSRLGMDFLGICQYWRRQMAAGQTWNLGVLRRRLNKMVQAPAGRSAGKVFVH